MLAASVMATHKIAGASLYRRHDFRVFVHIEASNVPVSEILSALEAAFSVRHRTSVPLDQAISGTYKGPLRRVLDGFNYYIANTVEGRMEITVIGKHGAAAMVANLPTAQATVAPQGLVVPPPNLGRSRCRAAKITSPTSSVTILSLGILHPRLAGGD